MAISLKATGAWVENVVAAPTVTLVGSPSDGDRYYIWAMWKDFGITITVPTGWTQVTQFTDGSVVTGNGVGSMKVACFYRNWKSGDANPVLTFSTATGLLSQIVCQLWQKGSTEGWAAPLFQTAAWPVTSATQTIAATSAAVGLPTGAVVMCGIAIRDDSATFTRATTAIDRSSGGSPTWNGNYVESPATHASSTTGDDMSCDLGHRFVSGGAAAVVLNASATISAVETGAILWVVQWLATPGITAETLADPYDTEDGAKWTGYNANVTATGGRLSIVPDNTFNRQLSSVSTVNITNSYAVVEVPDIGSCQSLSLILQDGTHRFQIGYNFGNLKLRESVSGTTNDVDIAYSAVNHRWFRIRESGGTVFWDTSPDGMTWTNRRSKVWEVPQIIAMTAIQQAFTASGTNPALLDNFNVLPGLLAATAKKATASLTGAMYPRGTIAAQLAKALFSGAAAQTQTGTVAALLKKATASLTGAEQPKGTVAATMRKATASFTGAQTQSGTITATLRKPTASFTGAMQPKGVIAGIARKPTAALTGSQQQVGVVAAASKNLTASLTGAQQPEGTISATAKRAAFTATGTQTQSGTMAAIGRRLAAALTGTQGQSGTISAAMRPVVAALSGAMQPSGFVTVTLRPLIFAASGAQIQTGVIAVAAQAAVAAMVGALYPDGAIASALKPPLFTGSGTYTAPPGTAAVTMKKLDASLSGHEAPEGAIGAAMNPAQFASHGEQGQQGIVAATLRAGTFAAVGNQPTSGALAAALHRLVFAGQGADVVASTGTMSGHVKRLAAALTGAMAPTGGISGKLSPPLFEGSADYFSPLGLRAVLRKLVFQSLRVALDSESRTTIIRGENRTTVIPGENRETFISGDNRLTLIE